MKKAMDKLFNNIKFDKKYVLFCLTLVMLGIITGSIFIVILNSSDKTLVIEFIEDFIDSLKNNSVDFVSTFKMIDNTTYFQV